MIFSSFEKFDFFKKIYKELILVIIRKNHRDNLRKRNLLIIGASGAVANAFLLRLVKYRKLFNKLVLVDKNNKLLFNKNIEHNVLDYTFIHKKIVLPKREREYFNILKKYSIDIVIDLTDDDTLPFIISTNKFGISIINTAMDETMRSLEEIMIDFYDIKDNLINAPHILCSGMNPGVVNMWAEYGIRKYGEPDQIIEFEYDNSNALDIWKPIVTWSKKQFIEEMINGPAGVMYGRDEPFEFSKNSLFIELKLGKFLKNVNVQAPNSKGFLTSHEECFSLAQKYDIPTKYLYGLHENTMKYLKKVYIKNGKITKKDILFGDNQKIPMKGADNIGLILRYNNKDIIYFNSISNDNATRTNATLIQVTVGVYAALFTLLDDDIYPGAHFVEDLFHTNYKKYLFDNMVVQEIIVKRKGNKCKLESCNPHIRLRRMRDKKKRKR